MEKSRIVVEEMMLNVEQEKKLPEDMIKKCAGVAIFPSMVKGGFFVGGAYGKGVVLKYKNGVWTGPAFITIGAGSFGLQFGAQSVDLILVILGEKTMDAFMRSKFKLGADVAVAAGPVGAQATAATEILLRGGIYSYSRTKGAFIGISLEGAGIGSNTGLNQAYYGNTGNTQVILAGTVKPPESGQKLIAALNKLK
ncbi:MAG: lipid-binding SYLF domain-containing protein [Desulfobacterales bacterium]|nr:MAG: lipid-binding SYLF domain-containing protein [Desulfobacterales bacterium]